jgi:K+-sensing histidine kinase KdpD
MYDELIKAWLKPEYLAMLVIITLTVKLAVVPLVKAFLLDTNVKGYTSIYIAYAGAILVSFLYKFLFPFGTWTIRDVLMVIIVGVFAALSAIGTNVTTQAMRGKDVSITDGY